MRSATAIGAVALLVLVGAPPARAGDILQRIRRDGILHCAATERPGYAEIEEGRPVGRAADLCRTAAEAVLGPRGRFALRLLDLEADFERIRGGAVDLAFLEPRVAAEHHLGPAAVPIGEAYRDRFAVMLPQEAPARRLADLGGRTICFMIGDPVWPLLEDGLARRAVAFRPFGFSEEVEMKDAYNVGRCDAMAGLASTLDALRSDRGVKHLRSRLLDEALGVDPVVAMVPPGDPDWAASVRLSLPTDAARD